MKNKVITLLFFLSITFCFGQKNKNEVWTENEKSQYTTLTKLANYVYSKKSSEISNQTLYDNYIYFDYVLKDTVNNRREERLSKFDTIFSFLENW